MGIMGKFVTCVAYSLVVITVLACLVYGVYVAWQGPVPSVKECTIGHNIP